MSILVCLLCCNLAKLCIVNVLVYFSLMLLFCNHSAEVYLFVFCILLFTNHIAQLCIMSMQTCLFVLCCDNIAYSVCMCIFSVRVISS